jgi:hypothetical protein
VIVLLCIANDEEASAFCPAETDSGWAIPPGERSLQHPALPPAVKWTVSDDRVGNEGFRAIESAAVPVYD